MRRQTLTRVLPALLATTLLAACTSPSESPTSAESPESGSAESGATAPIEIYAAASLKGVFTQLIEEFTADHPDAQFAPPVYDGSSTLATQILEGAPADIFASADERNMTTVTEAALVVGDPTLFATNRITAVVPADNPAGITSLADLANPDVKVVVCAPEVPCGGATARVLEAENLSFEAVSNEQNVSAVVTKVSEGEADAGFVYETDVKASAGTLVAIDTPVGDDLINRYPIALLRDARDTSTAQQFIDFVLSERGQEVLREAGYGKP